MSARSCSASTPSRALTSIVVKCPGVPSSALADSGSNATSVAPGRAVISPYPTSPTRVACCGGPASSTVTWSPSASLARSALSTSMAISSGPDGARPSRTCRGPSGGSDTPTEVAPPTTLPLPSTTWAKPTDDPVAVATPGTRRTSSRTAAGTGARSATSPPVSECARTETSDPPDRVSCRSSTLERIVSVSTMVPARNAMPSATAVALSRSLILWAAMPRSVTASMSVSALQCARELRGDESVSCGAGVKAVRAGELGQVPALGQVDEGGALGLRHAGDGRVVRRDDGPDLGDVGDDRELARHGAGGGIGQARADRGQPLDRRHVADQDLRATVAAELVDEAR